MAPAGRLIPPTRYQGSKRKLCLWIWDCLKDLDFQTALDAFSGTGSVAYLLKAAGKSVVANDILASNEQAAIALVENDGRRLPDEVVDGLVRGDGDAGPGTFIQDTFAGVYFTDEENAWLDRVRGQVAGLDDRHERAIAWYALLQSAVAKRPYNLFHRRNLYMRTADVPRSFGNKKSWDRPFAEHFRRFAAAANEAVIDGDGRCRATRGDAAEVAGKFDLVYIDPPYMNGRGVGVDYGHFYHFLEGLLDYDHWAERIDWTSKHRRMRIVPSDWTQPSRVHAAFGRLFARYAESVLVVSYRSDGIPGIAELVEMLRRFKSSVTVCEQNGYQYALSTNRTSGEVLIVAA